MYYIANVSLQLKGQPTIEYSLMLDIFVVLHLSELNCC